MCVCAHAQAYAREHVHTVFVVVSTVERVKAVGTGWRIMASANG